MKTQQVTIFGLIDAQGRYNASGWNDAEDHDSWLADGMPDDSDPSTWRKFTIEASVPIPDEVATVVEGVVVTQGPLNQPQE